MSDDSENPRVFYKNQKDLYKVEKLQDDHDRLMELYLIAEKIDNNEDLTSEEQQKYLSSGSPDIGELQIRIGNNELESERLEKMEDRCQPGYQLTPDTNPVSPESNITADSDMDNVESALPILF
jgi:hypothetical protein